MTGWRVEVIMLNVSDKKWSLMGFNSDSFSIFNIYYGIFATSIVIIHRRDIQSVLFKCKTKFKRGIYSIDEFHRAYFVISLISCKACFRYWKYHFFSSLQPSLFNIESLTITEIIIFVQIHYEITKCVRVTRHDDVDGAIGKCVWAMRNLINLMIVELHSLRHFSYVVC